MPLIGQVLDDFLRAKIDADKAEDLQKLITALHTLTSLRACILARLSSGELPLLKVLRLCLLAFSIYRERGSKRTSNDLCTGHSRKTLAQ